MKSRNEQLWICREDEILGEIPIEDLAAVIIDNPQTRFSQACLSKLLSENVAVVSSDVQHQPVGVFLPLQGHSVQTERFSAQVAMDRPLKKRLWQQLIKTKIRFQGRVLKDITGNDAGLCILATKVRSGDPDNLEAQAARRYWGRLFEGQGFRRVREAADQNRFLNYGYAVLRAMVARTICAVGLHPSLGLHHHNRYNALCLADDVMEPYRPMVDLKVVEICLHFGGEYELDREVKQMLLSVMFDRVMLKGEQCCMQTAISRTAQSLVRCIAGEDRRLCLPDV